MRPIDADALKQDLLKRNFYPAIVKCALEDAPAVDSVQVVRCKNCRHYDKHFNPNTKNYCYVDGGPIHRIMPPDGFCSDGERKEK